MKIAINARVLTERQGGPYRYTVNILHQLSKIDTKNIYYVILNNKYNFDFELPENFKVIVYKIKSKIIFDYIFMPLISYKLSPDVLLFPKNTFSPLVKGKKIPVFHDIIYFEKELNIKEFKFFDNLHHYMMIPVSAKFAAVNLAVSDFTASRMIKLLNINPATIKIIKEGVESKFKKITEKKLLDNVIKKYNLKFPFFFYSGSLSPRKNMLRVLQAFNAIKDQIPHNIYYTGGYSWKDNEVYDYIKKSNLENRVIKLGFLSDEELVCMYNLADCYLYPSLYEGFGLPILEAQACGCPVITSNISSCPEVAGNGAILVDPYNINDIANAMKLISKNKNLRREIIRKGYINKSNYSWKTSAYELLKLFEEVCKR